LNIAVKKALEVLTLHGLLDFYIDFRHLSRIIDNENIIFYTFPFEGRIKERYLATSDGIAQIAVDSNLSPPEQKHMTAHALGHHFLHQGNFTHINDIVQNKQEQQAENFAAVLLVPPPVLLQIQPSTECSLAQGYSIPLILAERRVEIYKKHGV